MNTPTWVAVINGRKRLLSKDRSKVDDYAARKMRERESVIVCKESTYDACMKG